MPARIRECQTKKCIIWRFGEGSELATIGEEIVQRQYRNPSSNTT